MVKKSNPLSHVETGTRQIYLDTERQIWRVRILHQNDPTNSRSPKKWRDIDIHTSKERLMNKYPDAQVIE